MKTNIIDLHKEITEQHHIDLNFYGIKEIKIGYLKDEIANFLRAFNLGKLIIICDENSDKIFADELAGLLNAPKIILAANIKPYLSEIEKLRDKVAASGVDALIAVGSGTISDICKYCSYLLNIPYIMIPTAPSMNGYTARNASIIKADFRSSVNAHLPLAVYTDIDINIKAPALMIKSGIADSICMEASCKADWLLSHYLLNSYYNNKIYDLTSSYMEELIKLTQDEFIINEDLIISLFKMLLVTGIAMTICSGSYPASQSEHMIAHSLEMNDKLNIEDKLHGQIIAVTTYSCVKIQNAVLKSGLYHAILGLKNYRIEEEEIRILENLLGAKKTKDALEQYNKKAKIINNIDFENLKITAQKIKNIENAIMSEQKYINILDKIGLPYLPETLNINNDIYENTVKIAKFTRNRFNFLDFL